MFLFKVILPKIENLETGDSKSDNMSKKGQKQRYQVTKLAKFTLTNKDLLFPQSPVRFIPVRFIFGQEKP